MIRARVPLIRLGLIGLLAPAIACAMPPVEVQALLPDRAMLRVAGTGYLLLEGESTPQGVRLVAADAGSALVEYAGRQHRLQLGASAGGGRVAAPAELRLLADPQGMYSSPGTINGQGVNFLIDTGATSVALSQRHAARLGIDYQRDGQPGRAVTAAGPVQAWRVQLAEVGLGPIRIRNVNASVLAGDHPQQPLLGMSFLGRTEMQHSGGLLVLRHRR